MIPAKVAMEDNRLPNDDDINSSDRETEQNDDICCMFEYYSSFIIFRKLPNCQLIHRYACVILLRIDSEVII